MRPTDFASLPYAHDAVALRRLDEAAKVASKRVPPLDEYRRVVGRVTLGPGLDVGRGRQ